MDELGGVLILAGVMGLLVTLMAAWRWKQDRQERQPQRITALKRTASPGPGAPDLHNPDPHNPDPHNSGPHNLEAGAPDLGDFVWPPQGEPDPPMRN